tara:strand:- start:19217 stop:20602 length:1386 start_codon:yes stop_codon:yes gene_type:complete
MSPQNQSKQTYSKNNNGDYMVLNKDGIAPNNTEAEKAVLGAVLKGGANTYEVASTWIKENRAFYNQDNQKIWKSMASLHKRHEIIDTVTVSDEVRKHLKEADTGMAYYISGLFEACPSEHSVEDYCKIVWERYIKREAIKSARILAKTAEDNNLTIADVLTRHERYSEELRNLEPTSRQTISNVVDSTLEHIERQDNVIPFGLEFMDRAAGGMTRQEITVIGGRPGHGKSTLMINIVSSLIQGGYKVMLFNREMSNTEMMKKLLCMECEKLDYDKVRRHELTKKEKQKLIDATEEVKKKYENFLMYDNIRTLGESLREVNRHKPDVVIDDYIQLIDMEGTADQRRLEVEKIMHEYKWLCKKIDCSAILISQLNREIEKRDDPVPQMADFAESGAIEQTAEMAAFVYYPFNTDPETNDRFESRIIIAKSRYGNIGRFTVGYDGNICKFFETIEEARKGKSDW